jgi:peptidyl-prolyl cis-trans isomerase C
VITVGDVQERVNKQSPFLRARYSTLDKKKEFLDNLIRFEVMAKEAERRGYDKDPEVVRVMKQQMISKFLQKDFESKLKVEDVPDVEVEKYYKEHGEEFNRPEEVRVSQILIKDKAKADKVAAEARAADKDKNDPKPFRDLVAKYSEDEDSKPRGGDSPFFDRSSSAYPKPIVEAAFTLKDAGEISPPVKTDRGYVILRLSQKRAAFSRPLPEVKRQIQQRLFRDVRTKALDAFIADLKKKSKITIDDKTLAKVAIDTAVEPGGRGHDMMDPQGRGHSMPPGARGPVPPPGGLPGAPMAPPAHPHPHPPAPGGPGVTGVHP